MAQVSFEINDENDEAMMFLWPLCVVDTGRRGHLEVKGGALIHESVHLLQSEGGPCDITDTRPRRKAKSYVFPVSKLAVESAKMECETYTVELVAADGTEYAAHNNAQIGLIIDNQDVSGVAPIALVNALHKKGLLRADCDPSPAVLEILVARGIIPDTDQVL